jgi:hypothetical protein
MINRAAGWILTHGLLIQRLGVQMPPGALSVFPCYPQKINDLWSGAEDINIKPFLVPNMTGILTVNNPKKVYGLQFRTRAGG